jgi:C_GCAxxG_C_C family probable redox protein
MTPEQMRDKASDLYSRRFHCTQAVLCAGLEKIGKVNEEVIKAFGAFGGGIAWSGRTCGALTGGIGVIASIFGRGNLKSTEDSRMRPICRKFIVEFEKLTHVYGGTDCRDIARINWQDEEMVKTFLNDPESSRKVCVQLVGDTAFALGRLLEAEGVGNGTSE